MPTDGTLKLLLFAYSLLWGTALPLVAAITAVTIRRYGWRRAAIRPLLRAFAWTAFAFSLMTVSIVTASALVAGVPFTDDVNEIARDLMERTGGTPGPIGALVGMFGGGAVFVMSFLRSARRRTPSA